MEEEKQKMTTTSPSDNNGGSVISTTQQDIDSGIMDGGGVDTATGDAIPQDDDSDAKAADQFGSSYSSSLKFQDESTDCAICLGSLDNNNDEMGEVIELTTCGHRWHLKCLREQLEQAQPNPAQRLVLTGCRCAKCGSICDHPKLRHITRATDVLREKIDKVLQEHVLQDNEKNSQTALEEARRKYAIYLCSHCREPYFGGSIICSDIAPGSEGEVPPNERLCVACAPTRLFQQQQQQQQQEQSLLLCRHPLEHRGHHVWKCRYCCNVATHVCYGTVHFCQSCHDRNSERVDLLRRQQQQLRNRRRRQHEQGGGSQEEPPACLTAIPCKGGNSCPFPKPSGETHHKNGKSSDCEQVYGCGWCQSNPAANQNHHHHHAFQEPPGSRNLLYNSSGQDHNLEGWKQLIPNSQWRVEDSEVPLSPQIRTNFVSTYHWCAMSQVVPLHRFIRQQQQQQQGRGGSILRIEASAKYMARTDCPSIFRMELILLDRNRRIIKRQRTNQLDAPADFWDRASLTIEVPPTTAGTTTTTIHEVVMIVYGKDVPFWAGYFGSKVTDCQLRVLGNPEELEQIMIPEEDVMEVEAAVAGGWAHGQHRPLGRGQQVHQSWWRTRILEIALPVVCLIILAWLIQ